MLSFQSINTECFLCENGWILPLPAMYSFVLLGEGEKDRECEWNTMNHGKEIVSQTLVIQATALKEARAIHTEF